MNILFMSLSNFDTIYCPGIYSDLLRQFINHGDKVYVLAPFERKNDDTERVIDEPGVRIVKIRIRKMQQTNAIEKGISMLTIDGIFKRAIKKYFADIKFDLILYPTPPITLVNVVDYVKKRDGAKTYLLLKDIFPQNAVDIGLMSTDGIKGLVYKHFRKKEKKLYAVSDYIGCMSQANVDYVINHNPEVDAKTVMVCPNSIDPVDMSCTAEERLIIREKYGIPADKTVFVYGGNLGKPQDISFVLECVDKCKDNKNAFFLIAGNGTEFGKIESFISDNHPDNLKLIQRLPKEDYDRMIGSCDVGLIFLDHRFTIPNFPSRLLSYMTAKLPVLACTDKNTDIGKTIVDGGFGWWCESDNEYGFSELVETIISQGTNLPEIGKQGFRYLNEQFTSERTYRKIFEIMKNE